jgi:hypothetical protein
MHASLAANAGDTYISPFIRKELEAGGGMVLIRQIRAIYGYPAKNAGRRHPHGQRGARLPLAAMPDAA